MNLSDFFHGTTRPAWTARLLAYIALVVTISLALQVLFWVWWW